mmetsp:Transcript_13032/g.42686  ORF Transcript_13032/g.42686 Transcript_13032/m.42686 type:complete len:399 (+) Transcript_13032:645-1841(+)
MSYVNMPSDQKDHQSCTRLAISWKSTTKPTKRSSEAILPSYRFCSALCRSMSCSAVSLESCLSSAIQTPTKGSEDGWITMEASLITSDHSSGQLAEPTSRLCRDPLRDRAPCRERLMESGATPWCKALSEPGLELKPPSAVPPCRDPPPHSAPMENLALPSGWEVLDDLWEAEGCTPLADARDEAEVQCTPGLRWPGGEGAAVGSGWTAGRRIPSKSLPSREERMPIMAEDDMPGSARPPALAKASMANSEMNCSRAVGMCRSAWVELSEYGLCPRVKDSQVTPKCWIEEAWFTLRQTALSADASAFSRPSGRPTANREPRTTLCVCRCSRWSIGLAEATLTVAMEKESAKHLETKASTDWATHGMSPIRMDLPATRCSHGRRWTRRSSTVVHHGRKT